MPEVTVSSLADVEALEAKLAHAATNARDSLREVIERGSPLDFIYAVKFEPVGRHSLTGEPLNLMEQVNQHFTYAVTYEAMRLLMNDHPEITKWKLNLGTSAGSDIESSDRTVAAEVFAAVDPTNNNKLLKDVRRIDDSDAQHKYVFFQAPDHAGDQPRKQGYENVTIIALSSAVLRT